MLKYIIVFFIEALFSIFFTSWTVNLLKQGRCMAENYRQAKIPCPLGIAYIPFITLSLLIYLILFNNIYFFNYMLFSFSAVIIAFSGIIDDFAGKDDNKGFRKHFNNLLHGDITTGVAKAFLGFLISVFTSACISQGFFEFILNLLIVPLFINTLNLFDVKPGRSIKVFLLYYLFLLPFSMNNFQLCLPLHLICLPTVVMLCYDLGERGMLGDTGSNLLGFILGFYSALLLPLYIKPLIILLLAALNIISEFKPLSAIIGTNRLLSYLDLLGRKKDETSHGNCQSKRDTVQR